MSEPLTPEREQEIRAARYTVRSNAAADIDIDDLLAELESRPAAEDVAAWLVKKAHEYRTTPKSRQESAPDFLARLASKVQRGAIRPAAAPAPSVPSQQDRRAS